MCIRDRFIIIRFVKSRKLFFHQHLPCTLQKCFHHIFCFHIFFPSIQFQEIGKIWFLCIHGKLHMFVKGSGKLRNCRYIDLRFLIQGEPQCITFLCLSLIHILDTLTLCGLLHDIGKLKIPDEILNKPGKYTDEEFDLVKRHTKFGYELLKTLNIDPHIKKAALLHHERCDGSGYPLKATQKDLDDFSMVVAIADVYDAMTAARSYRAPLCPFQVIERFEQERCV